MGTKPRYIPADIQMDCFRDNIRTYCENTRVQLKEISADAGITYEALRLFLNGGEIKGTTLVNICHAMGYTPNTLLRTAL